MNLQAWNYRRFFNGVRAGDAERVRKLLEVGVDANMCDRRGRPAMIVAVRTLVVESGVVDALLDAGADPQATDADGRTALQYARRRLERLGPGPDRVHRSPALDEHGNVRLDEEEREMLTEWRRAAPDVAAEAEGMYIQERRKAALRQFMPRRELRFIVRRLEEAQA
ncbi:MAG: ankyrin repeat domain-containing protein [Planctomycetota bacterium]